MKKELSLQPLMEAGVHFGYSRTRRHPTVTPFLYGTKGGVDIIDLEKTAPMMESAANFLSELSAAGKTVLFVGVKPEARKVGVPVIALGNTDCSIRAISYPIIVNDSSASSIRAVLAILKDAFSK